MGKVTRKRYTADFKAKVALEAIKGEHTLTELAAKHGIHHTLIATWKRQAIEGMASTFSLHRPDGHGGQAKPARQALRRTRSPYRMGTPLDPEHSRHIAASLRQTGTASKTPVRAGGSMSASEASRPAIWVIGA